VSARVVVAVLLLSSAARAQDTGIVADRFVPGLGPHALLAAEAAEVTAPGEASFAMSLDALGDPIRLRSKFTGERVSTPVAGQIVGDLGMELGVVKRLAVAIGMPVVLYARGDRLAGTGVSDRPLAAPVGGDLRLRVKAAFVGDPTHSGLHVAVLVQLTVPTGGEGDFAATSGVTVEPRLIADYRVGIVTVAIAIGARFAPERKLFLTTFDDELTWVGGVGVAAVRRGAFRFDVIAEAAGGVGAADGTRPVELRGAARFGLGAWSVDLGGGAGLDADVGAPSWRALAVLRGGLDYLH
jgi:hypothetical protein